MNDRASLMTHHVAPYDRSPPVSDELLDEIVRRICVVGSPLKIVLFGSRAQGRAKRDSDIDILVLEEAGVSRRERQGAYSDALDDLYPDLDLLVYTMAEVAEWQTVPNHLLSESLRAGITLFEDWERLSAYYHDLTYPEGGAGSLVVCEGSQPKTQADLARGWYAKGDSDLQSGKLIVAGGSSFDTACFHAQQAIEKYMKGFLQLHGRRWPKTHSLDQLRWQCCKIADLPDLKPLRLKHISKYCEARYENGFWPRREEAEEALAVAERVRAAILASSPPEARP